MQPTVILIFLAFVIGVAAGKRFSGMMDGIAIGVRLSRRLEATPEAVEWCTLLKRFGEVGLNVKRTPGSRARGALERLVAELETEIGADREESANA